MAQSKVVADGLQSHATTSTATTSTADTQTVDSREHTSGLATSVTPLSPGPTPVAAGSPGPTPVAAGSVRGGAVPTVSLDDLWRVSSAPGGGVERSGEEQLSQKSPPSQHSAVSMGTISLPPGPNVEPIPVTADVEPGQSNVTRMEPGQDNVTEMEPGQDNVAGMEPGQDNVAGMEPGQDSAGEAGLDPVMMKYMELVQQRREQQKAQVCGFHVALVSCHTLKHCLLCRQSKRLVVHYPRRRGQHTARWVPPVQVLLYCGVTLALTPPGTAGCCRGLRPPFSVTAVRS